MNTITKAMANTGLIFRKIIHGVIARIHPYRLLPIRTTPLLWSGFDTLFADADEPLRRA